MEKMKILNLGKSDGFSYLQTIFTLTVLLMIASCIAIMLSLYKKNVNKNWNKIEYIIQEENTYEMQNITIQE